MALGDALGDDPCSKKRVPSTVFGELRGEDVGVVPAVLLALRFAAAAAAATATIEEDPDGGVLRRMSGGAVRAEPDEEGRGGGLGPCDCCCCCWNEAKAEACRAVGDSTNSILLLSECRMEVTWWPRISVGGPEGSSSDDDIGTF